MPRCPQCNKVLAELMRRCPSCMADLDLLVDYVSHLQTGLDEAKKLTRAGELGGAVWAYLTVLEVDPDNPTARHQVGQVATAVRQFDRTAPGRRWLSRVREGRAEGEAGPAGTWLRAGLAILLLLAAFALGYTVRVLSEPEGTPPPHHPPQKPDKRRDTLGSVNRFRDESPAVRWVARPESSKGVFCPARPSKTQGVPPKLCNSVLSVCQRTRESSPFSR
jgi:hypothetical protein